MRMKIVTFCVAALFSQTAFAEHRMRPLSIVAERASVITDASVHFGCELRVVHQRRASRATALMPSAPRTA